MPPPDKRTGPEGNGTGIESLGSAHDSTPSADNLWNLAARAPVEVVKWLSLGWRLGLIDGRDEGFHAAELDMAVRWHEVWLDTQKVLRRPSWDALTERRVLDHLPCPTGRFRDCSCSRCTHALAYKRRGCRPYLGVEAEAELARAGAA